MNKQTFFFILVVFILFNAHVKAMNPAISELRVKIGAQAGVFYAPLTPDKDKQPIFLPLGQNSLYVVKALAASPLSDRDKNKFFKSEWPASEQQSESSKKKKPRVQ